MDGSLHDRDFFTWTQEQAAALRRLAAARPNLLEGLDLPNLIEEVEDLGGEQVAKVRSHLPQMLKHMLLVAFAPDDQAVRSWRGEIVTFRDDAVDPYRHSMRQGLEPRLDGAWRTACAAAAEKLGHPLPGLPEACPFTLHELLDEALSIDALLARLTAKD
ncbi:DUF29 domain-containing protein [Belnapia sp. F-4-1]|uniref:DUF29 domain-containing protein n=1 Tax=Belnapia sp. F-4-1 TaxID=1545443 RepID=UPI0005BDD823|nr:DUF29 domain-containing protein [Belnapia sp. F-4-1]